MFEKDNRATDVKIKNLFQEYNSLFYDIPKTGILSHSILFIQSRDYINDFYDPKELEKNFTTINAPLSLIYFYRKCKKFVKKIINIVG